MNIHQHFCHQKHTDALQACCVRREHPTVMAGGINLSFDTLDILGQQMAKKTVCSKAALPLL